MVSKWFPNVVTSGQQYNIGENPTVILYTYYINPYAGTPKPQSRNTVKVFYLRSMLPSKRFDPSDWGMLRRSRCVQIFL